LVARLLRACRFAQVLTTGREALRVEGEKILLLSPLSLPAHDRPSAAEALSSTAVQLFMARALLSGHSSELRDADAPVVVDICRRLDGIALAIELVASRVGSYGIRGTADLLERDAALRLQGSEERSARHRTLQTMLDWSFNMLSEGEQHLFCMLAIFVGPFTHEALQAVAYDGTNLHVLPSAITSLVDKSLVAVVTSGPLQYRLLDTTRDYAVEKLESSGHMASTAERHASYFASLLRSGVKDGSDFDGREAANYSGQLGNIRKALQWSFADRSRHAIGLDLASHAVPIFRGLSQFIECQYWCRQAIACLTVRDRETALEFQLFYALARSAVYAPGDFADVIEVFDHALRLAGRLALTRSELNLLADLNVILTRRGDFTRALHAAETSASVANRFGGSAEKILSEWLLGASYHASGDQAAALHHCKQGFRLASYARPVQLDLLSEARARFAFARSLWLQGFPDQAVQAAHETIYQMSRYNHHVAYCFALVYTIPVFLWAGDLKAAAVNIQDAIDHAVKYSLGTFQAIARSQKGELSIAAGDLLAGLKDVQEAHSEMVIGPYHIAASYTACVLAKALAAAGDGDEAQKVLDAAMLRADRVEEQCWRPILLLTRGEVFVRSPNSNFETAERMLRAAVECARQQHALSWELKSALSLADLWRRNGQVGAALSLLEKLYARFTEGFDTPDLLYARRLIGSLNGATAWRAQSSIDAGESCFFSKER
jgi:predicted ATPase